MGEDLGPVIPAKDDYPVYTAVWPEVGKPLSVTLLNPGWVARVCHWDAGDGERKPRHYVCVGDEWCACRQVFSRRQWIAYIGAFSHRTHKRCVCVLGIKAAQQLAELRERSKGLRGRRVNLTRSGDNPYGPVTVTLDGSPALRDLPDELDLRWTLRAIYGPAGWLFEGEDARAFAWRGGKPCAS